MSTYLCVLLRANSRAYIPVIPIPRPVPDLITTADAAKRKGCTQQAIRNALARGDLHGQKLGGTWAVADDAALAAYAVKETGGRTHRKPSPEASGVELPTDT